MVLDQNAYKSLQRPEHGPVQHHRGMTLTVLADVARPEPGRQVRVHLQGAALPLAPDRIPQHELELRSVKCALARVERRFDPGGSGGLLQRTFVNIPDLIRTYPFGRPIGEFYAHVLEAEIVVNA